MYDFDQFVDRRGTHCCKWDSQFFFGQKDGLLPFWIADGLALGNGAHYGEDGFMRLNIGCPRVTLEKGMEQMAAMYEAYVK